LHAEERPSDGGRLVALMRDSTPTPMAPKGSKPAEATSGAVLGGAKAPRQRKEVADAHAEGTSATPLSIVVPQPTITEAASSARNGSKREVAPSSRAPIVIMPPAPRDGVGRAALTGALAGLIAVAIASLVTGEARCGRDDAAGRIDAGSTPP
jgi:hypothetical protein